MGSHLISKSRNGSAEIRQIFDGFRRIVQALRLTDRAAEKRLGISAAQLFVLQQLAANSRESMSLMDLAAATHTHQSSASAVVQKLVESRLVARVRAADDARRLELRLAPAGKALLRDAPPAAQEHLAGTLRSFSGNERREFARLLGRLVHGLSSDEPPMFFEERRAASKGPGKKS